MEEVACLPSSKSRQYTDNLIKLPRRKDYESGCDVIECTCTMCVVAERYALCLDNLRPTLLPGMSGVPTLRWLEP